MRVRIYNSGGETAELGARRLEVECPVVKPSARERIKQSEKREEFDEVDLDCDIAYRRKVFKLTEREEARKYALTLAHGPDSAFGQALIHEQVVDWFVEEDRIGDWENVGEPEYVD